MGCILWWFWRKCYNVICNVIMAPHCIHVDCFLSLKPFNGWKCPMYVTNFPGASWTNGNMYTKWVTFNSLSHGRGDSNYKSMVFNPITQTGRLRHPLWYCSQVNVTVPYTNEKSTSHYLSQCFMLWYSVTIPPCVDTVQSWGPSH